MSSRTVTTTTDKSKMLKLTKRDYKGRTSVVFSLYAECLKHVLDVSNPKEMWAAIMNIFELHAGLKNKPPTAYSIRCQLKVEK